MGRPQKNRKPLTELERLRKEVQELKTENALLKKVRALVEERNARLREIGQVLYSITICRIWMIVMDMTESENV